MTATQTSTDGFYMPEAAARSMVDNVPTALAEETVEVVIARVTSKAWDAVDVLCLLDSDGSFRGLIDMRDVFDTPRDAAVGKLPMKTFAVPPAEDQERAALLAVDQELLAVPVVDTHGKLLGLISTETLLGILHREHSEDFHRLAGIHASHEEALHSTTASPFTLVKGRVPWLILGFTIGMLATGMVGFFEESLHEKLALAFFIPIIVYISDAVGTQTETVFVRSLTVQKLSVLTYLRRELLVGTIIGLMFAVLVFPVVTLIWQDWVLAAIISAAMFGATAVATVVATMVPYALHKTGRDPAFGAGPLGTVIQDFLSLFIYFVIATVLLRVLA